MKKIEELSVVDQAKSKAEYLLHECGQFCDISTGRAFLQTRKQAAIFVCDEVIKSFANNEWYNNDIQLWHEIKKQINLEPTTFT